MFESTTDWDKLNEKDLKPYQVIIWLNDFPHTPAQRAAFENYMEHGGAWLGFHVAGYNDATTKWPWFVELSGWRSFLLQQLAAAPCKINGR